MVSPAASDTPGASATTAPAATATVPSATATATVATPTAAASCFTRLGFVHGQVPTVVVAGVEALDRRLGLGVRTHLHEPEPLGTVRITVNDDLCALHG